MNILVEDTSPRDRKVESTARRMVLENEYAFDKFVVIAYPSKGEIQDIIRNIFGSRDGPEYIGTPEAYR